MLALQLSIGSRGHVCITYLQPLTSSKPNIPSTTLATNCPQATIATLVDTNLPLMFEGEHSAMYIGIVVDVNPEKKERWHFYTLHMSRNFFKYTESSMYR